MKDKISVFGSTGFIGSEYCSLYEDEIARVERDNYIPKSSEILYLISTIDNYNVFADPFLDIDTNLSVLIETLENCKDREDVVFNFISSWFVYGKTDDLPAKEESYCNPKGFYSITKRAAEQLLVSYCETFKLNYRIIRLCNVYGTSDKKASKKRNALQYLIGEVANNRDINLYDSGDNIRDFLHVKDVCRAINLILKEGSLDEIYNVGSGMPYKFVDIMNYVKRNTNSRSEFVSVEPPEFHKIVQVKDMYLDTTKLKELGFKPKYDFWKEVDILIEKAKKRSIL